MADSLAFDLVPTHLAVQAMRDNGYRNTAYAVAELIDNSIQAGATSVELLCCEDEELVQHRVRRRIAHVAVLDNGSGMDAKVLRMALQFGNGTHLGDRNGIGRFGMGLPSASISQCKKVEVWSWTDGPASSVYSYIDLEEVARSRMREVPAPTPRALPELWTSVARSVARSGTLVVWSVLDRCMWRTALSVIRNSEFLIGRMYRRFLHDGRVAIRLAAFVKDDPTTMTIDDYAVANDPMYLMVPSSTPAPYDNEPLFQHDGDNYEIPMEIEFQGVCHTVKIRFSFAREEARNRPNAGATDYGKHAARNIGVSLVRADRELDMDQALVNGYDPRERWWGVEVDFPPSLDELFGVTNNKQAARHFSEVASNIKSLLSGGETSLTERLDNLKEDEDPTLPLMDIISLIDRRLGTLRNLIKVQHKGTGKGRKRYDPNAPEVQATEVTRERQLEGHEGFSDADEQLPEAERTATLTQELVDTGLGEEQARELAARTIESGIKYTFAEANLEGRSFFTVRPVAGEILIKININHPAYKNLVEVLEEDVDDDLSPEHLRERLTRANRGLKLLLMAWARYEDEQPSEEKREEIQDIRTDWGRVAARFLRNT
ncbi:MAG TPA: ATP-binding protein [Candidatus Limnocylindrales bacterium]|nr:ATP-binding protein [Candidatus Limnocylindrales bacterium]